MAGSARERRRAMYPNAFHSVPRYIPQDRPDDNGPGRTTADACLSQVVVYVDISGRSWTPLVLDVAVEAVAGEPVSSRGSGRTGKFEGFGSNGQIRKGALSAAWGGAA